MESSLILIDFQALVVFLRMIPKDKFYISYLMLREIKTCFSFFTKNKFKTQKINKFNQLIYSLNYQAFKPLCTIVFQSLILEAVISDANLDSEMEDFIECLLFLLKVLFWDTKHVDKKKQIEYIISFVDSEKNSKDKQNFDWIRLIFKTIRNLCFNLNQLNKISNHYIADITVNLSSKEKTLVKNISVFDSPSKKIFYIKNEFGPFDINFKISDAFQMKLIKYVMKPEFNLLITPFGSEIENNLEMQASDLSKFIFFGCFYDCSSYLKETPLERIINQKSEELLFYKNCMIFAHFIDDETFKILLEKFIKISKKLGKKDKIIFFSKLAQFFSSSNLELARVRKIACKILLKELEMKSPKNEEFLNRLIRLIKSMFIKFTLNFKTLSRLNFRMISYVRDPKQIVSFFWNIIASFCDLNEVGLIKDEKSFINIFLEDKYLIPNFVKMLISNDMPFTNLPYFNTFFRFLGFVSDVGLKFFNYEFLFKFCENICNDLDRQINISNVDEDGDKLLTIFNNFSEMRLFMLPEILEHLTNLKLPILVPTFILIDSISLSKNDILSKSNYFFYKLCFLILDPSFYSLLLSNRNEISLYTKKKLKLYWNVFKNIIGFLFFNIKPIFKLVLLAIAWIIKPMVNHKNLDSTDEGIQFLKDSFFEKHWNLFFSEAFKKDKLKKYGDVYKQERRCREFLLIELKAMRKPRKANCEKYFRKTSKIIAYHLEFNKNFKLNSQIFSLIKDNIRSPLESSFWTDTRKFELNVHFNEVLKSLSLLTHHYLRDLFIKSSIKKSIKNKKKITKKEIFLKGNLRVPGNKKLLYLFSMCIQVKSSFCVRNTSLKLVKSKKLNNVTQDFEMNNFLNAMSYYEAPENKKVKRKKSIAPKPLEEKDCIINLKESFQEISKKHKKENGECPAELYLLIHLFGKILDSRIISYYNAVKTKGFNKVIHGILILTDSGLVFIHHIQIDKSGMLYYNKQKKKRTCPYTNYISSEFIHQKVNESESLGLKTEKIDFYKIKEIHQKPCMLNKNGLEIFLESGKIFSFVLPLKLYKGFFKELTRSLSEFFVEHNNFLNVKPKGYNLDNSEYYFIIIQGVACRKTLNFKTKKDLTLELLNLIFCDKVDNFSLLAGFNILAGKSLSQNNNTFIYPLLCNDKCSEVIAKYSVKNVEKNEEVGQSTDVNVSNAFQKKTTTEENEIQVINDEISCSDTKKSDNFTNLSSEKTSNQSNLPKSEHENQRELTCYSGINLIDFGESLQFLDKKVFRKRSIDTEDFQNCFYLFDRTEINNTILLNLQQKWKKIIKKSSLSQKINFDKMKFEKESIQEKINSLSLTLLKCLYSELVREETSTEENIHHSYFHLNLFSNSHFLMRMHPFTEYHLWTKSGFDNMNRTFNSFKDHYTVTKRDASTEEIVPFVFCCPEVFFNSNCLEHKNFSGFVLPPRYKNYFYQNFVDDLYYMLLQQKSKKIVRWISLILDNYGSKTIGHSLFKKYFKIFYKPQIYHSIKDKKVKQKLRDILFLGNQGSIGVHFSKAIKDFKFSADIFLQNTKNLNNWKETQKSKTKWKFKCVDSYKYEINILQDKYEQSEGENSNESEQLSPDLVSASFSEEDTSHKNENLKYLFCEKIFHESCGPLKKFLTRTKLTQTVTVSRFKHFLIRQNLQLLFKYDNIILISSNLYQKEFLWVSTQTGKITCQKFFDFDESIPMLGNSQGQVIFLKIYCKSQVPFGSKIYNQYMLRSSMLNIILHEKFNQFHILQTKHQYTHENVVNIKNLVISHLWTAHYSKDPITSIRRSENTKFVLCGNSKGKVIILDFFTRSLIRLFDSFSLKYPSILKCMFTTSQFKNSTSLTLTPSLGYSPINSANSFSSPYMKDYSQNYSTEATPNSANQNKVLSSPSCSEFEKNKFYLSINKSPFLMGPVLSIDISFDDKILVVSQNSFSLFNANGALLSIYYEEKAKTDCFRKGGFVEGYKVDKRIFVLMVTNSHKLKLFKAVQNKVDKSMSSANNFNYFLNSSRFYYFNSLELLFKESYLYSEQIKEIYSSDANVVDVFFIQPNLLYILTTKETRLKIFKIRLSIYKV